MSEFNLEPWQAIKEKSQSLKASASTLSKLSVKLEKVCSEGSLSEISTLGVQIAAEVSQLQDLESTIAEIAD